ncbi:tRNA(His) guanylyltransferase Thg1 family protein [Neptunomonas antarctica]|nr:tRNA(His) guanylyltransferase Thg1 family protein [Neptunomonas antarctica]
MELLSNFCSLEKQFKLNERKSECLGEVEYGKYICVRLDGIGLSKKYLKNDISNTKFDGAMWQAFLSTYEALNINKDKLADAPKIFLGAIICSDEISIIFDSQSNYCDRRLFKIVTTIASTFSSFFTRNGCEHFKKKLGHKICGAFDGRPLVFSSVTDVSNYMTHRYAICIRNSMSKILRVSGVDASELYSRENFNNIDYYKRKIDDLSLQEQYKSVFDKPIVFLPNYLREMQSYRHESMSRFILGLNGEIFE